MTRYLFLLTVLLITAPVACTAVSTDVPTQSATHKPGSLDQPRPFPRATIRPLQTPVTVEQIRQFITPPDRNLFQLNKELASSKANISKNITVESKEYSEGHSETFWLIDLYNTKTYQSDFTLALVTPNAYWYIEDNLDVSMVGLKQSAINFENDVYPVITEIFGSEWPIEANDDSRLNILNAKLENVAGYFSSSDQYPISIQPRSNQRKIIYVNAEYISPGSANYDVVLSHELQHVIHWNADATEDTWVNEGLSELASSIALESTPSIQEFLRGAPTSLVHWPTSSSSSIANYGAASLFMHFFTEHYGGQNNLKNFLSQPEDGISGIDRYLKELGYEENFKEIFKQWTAANILDERYQVDGKTLGYQQLEVSAAITSAIRGMKSKQSEIPQYAVEYTELESIFEPFQLSFLGNKEVPLLPVEVEEIGCWWSNSGDSIDSTLIYHIGELPIGSTEVFEYEIWFAIEKYWDYFYIEVSVDEGKTWQVIETPKTSRNNPLGNAFGPGYTGDSIGWLADSVALTPFAGGDVLVRFQYVTDDAITAEGACLRNISVSKTAIPSDDDRWDSNGFVFTDNIVRQDFQVQLITIGPSTKVQQLTLDLNNSGKWTIQPPQEGERLIVAVGALAEKTREPAGYTLSLAAAN